MPLRFLLRCVTRLRFLIALFLAPPLFCRAQTNLTIYADALASGWLDYSYGITANFAATAPVHSGGKSISATTNGPWGGVQLYHAPMTNSGLRQFDVLDQRRQRRRPATAGLWQSRFIVDGAGAEVSIEPPVCQHLAAIHHSANFSGRGQHDQILRFRHARCHRRGAAVFYLDDLQLSSTTVPTLINILVNATQISRHIMLAD